ncbi:sulfite exporter TauE/SafE family protein [Arcanobacterium hippocoleae]
MFGNIAIALAVGLFVGVIVGMLGAGGGILSVPILVYVLGQDPHAAAAGSLVIVGLTALVSLFAQYRRVHFRDGIVFGTLSILGAWGGSRLNLLVDPDLLMYSFGILLLCVSAAMFHKAVRQLQKERGAEAEAAADSAGAASAADSRESRDSESALRTGDFSRIFVLIFVLR